jgi:hypothetical protein
MLTPLFLIGLFLSGVSLTWGESACEDCDAVLRAGIFSSRADRGDQSAYVDSFNYVANASYQEMKDAFSAGGGATFAGFGLNANTTSGELSIKQTQMRADSRYNSATKSSHELLEQYGDPTIIAAWSKCKSDCNSSTAINSWVEPLDENNFVLKFKCNQGVRTSIQSATFDNARVIGPPLSGKIEPQTTYAIDLRRENPTLPIIIDIRLQGQSNISEFVPKVIPVYTPTIATAQVVFEIASAGEGSAPNRILIPNANGLHQFSNGVQDTYGNRIDKAELILINKSMPPNGDPNYWGYLSAGVDPQFPNRVGIAGAMYAGVAPFQAMINITYEK